ncbi:ABC transporter ATP-binding protein [Magnetococcales bacterium HHB-1]
MSDVIIQVEGFVVEYPGKRVFDHISLSIPSGSVIALVGPNGIGKTTLMRAIAGLITPLAGSVLVDGVDVFDDPRACHQKIGYLSDFFGLYDDLTVEQCLSYAAWSHHLSTRTAEERIEEVISQVGLQDYVGVKAGTLSRGWRQRLGIAQSIIHAPPVLFLDEPASGLDPQARNDLAILLRHLNRAGMTIVVSSHILAELEQYASHMLSIYDAHTLKFQSIQEETSQGQQVRLCLEFLAEAKHWLEPLSALETVANVDAQEDRILFDFSGTLEARVAVLKHLISEQAPVSAFYAVQSDMQETYLAQVRQHQQAGV